MLLPQTAAADENHELCAMMAVNSQQAYQGDKEYEITPPLLVFDKAYVDVYAVADMLGIGVEWIDAYVGFVRVYFGEKWVDFTLIQNWGELISERFKFFVIDEKIYVPVRELSQFMGVKVYYDNGIISFGGYHETLKEKFGYPDQTQMDEYVYNNYPDNAVYAEPSTVEAAQYEYTGEIEYVVNPYRAYSYENMCEDALRLGQMYPDLIKVSGIGKSVENRDLLLMEFGRGKNKIFVCGTHHAREYIASTYLMYTVDRYAYAYKKGDMWGKYNPKDILDNITFCIVPMVNPDGVNLVQNGIKSTGYASSLSKMKIYESPGFGYSAWKANIRGVDVNWNYNKDWSVYNNLNPRGSTGFNGDYANSEPETAAVSKYVDSNSFDAFLSLHTQGQIFYWADDMSNPSYINELIAKDTGFKGIYDNGKGSGGSFFDYVYRKFNKPTITVELCPYVGNYPYPNKDFDRIWTPAKNVMLIMANEVIYRNNMR